MGLDITAYSRLERVGKHEKDPARNEGEPGGLDDWCYYDGHVQAFTYDSFPQSFRGIPVLGTKSVSGGSKVIVGGCFAVAPETGRHAFHAGSYGGYGRWRADLARQFNPGPPHDPDGPFYELVWFADNEGSIGPEAAADLLADFRAHVDRYAPPVDDEWYADQWRARFADWTRAFELAADGGLVRFH